MASTDQTAPAAAQARRETGLELSQAYALLQGGRLRDAESICRTVLARMPREAGALHLLGLIRKNAPGIARSWVEETWKKEKADQRSR